MAIVMIVLLLCIRLRQVNHWLGIRDGPSSTFLIFVGRKCWIPTKMWILWIFVGNRLPCFLMGCGTCVVIQYGCLTWDFPCFKIPTVGTKFTPTVQDPMCPNTGNRSLTWDFTYFKIPTIITKFTPTV